MIRATQWQVYCEGQLVGAWAGEAPEWCELITTVTGTRDVQEVWQEARSRGWRSVRAETVCPGCAARLTVPVPR